MCTFYGSSYRLGTVVDAIVSANGSRAPSRSLSQAREIGLVISDRSPRYLASFEAVLRDYSSKPDRQLQLVGRSEDDPVHGRFDPGLIIDFPEFKIADSKNGYTVAFRTCLTVCTGMARSKIWTRATVSEVKGTPYKRHIGNFSSDARQICASLNEACRALYEEDYVLPGEPSVCLTPHGNIHLLAVDCSGAQFEAELDQTIENLYHSGNTPQVIESKQLADPLRFVVTASKAPHQLCDAQPVSPSFSLSKDASLFPFRCRSGAPSIFVSYAEGNTAYLYGLVAPNTTGHMPPDSGMKPYSKQATAEIANVVGKPF